MTSETKCTPNPGGDEYPLCSSASISLDLKPVAQAIASVGSGMREEGATSRKKVGELAVIMSSIGNDVAQNAKLLLGLQRCLQTLEEEMRRLADQNIRVHFMKPLAQKLLGLRASAAVFMDKEDFVYIANAIDDLLGDFDIQLIEPELGESFDPKTMKPRVYGSAEQKASDLVVQEVLLPGARHGDCLLEFAQVKLFDRINYVSSCARPEVLCDSVLRD